MGSAAKCGKSTERPDTNFGTLAVTLELRSDLDVIRRRGENVTAAEIEGVLAAFPGVLEVAVIGVPSDLGEEDIVAYAAPASIDVAALTAFAKERLADFKVPQLSHLRDSLPHTATARFAKHLLR